MNALVAELQELDCPIVPYSTINNSYKCKSPIAFGNGTVKSKESSKSINKAIDAGRLDMSSFDISYCETSSSRFKVHRVTPPLSAMEQLIGARYPHVDLNSMAAMWELVASAIVHYMCIYLQDQRFAEVSQIHPLSALCLNGVVECVHGPSATRHFHGYCNKTVHTLKLQQDIAGKACELRGKSDLRYGQQYEPPSVPFAEDTTLAELKQTICNATKETKKLLKSTALPAVEALVEAKHAFDYLRYCDVLAELKGPDLDMVVESSKLMSLNTCAKSQLIA